MTIVVTGAGGFIASALIAALNARATHESERVVSLSRQDVDLPDSELQQRCKGATAFIHIAGRAHKTVEPLGAEPLYHNENVLLTRRMLHLAQHCGIGHFLYLSSISVNGSYTTGAPFTENDAPNPQTPYAQSKLDAENRIIEYCSEHHMNWTIIRSPMVYGPHAAGNVGWLQKLIQTGVPLPFGSFNNKRGFISIENLCDLFAHCLHAKSARNQLYLATDGIDRSTRELMHILAAQMNRKVTLLPFPVFILKLFAMLTGLTVRLRPLWVDLQISPDKIFNQLGWRPKDVR